MERTVTVQDLLMVHNWLSSKREPTPREKDCLKKVEEALLFGIENMKYYEPKKL